MTLLYASKVSKQKFPNAMFLAFFIISDARFQAITY